MYKRQDESSQIADKQKSVTIAKMLVSYGATLRGQKAAPKLFKPKKPGAKPVAKGNADKGGKFWGDDSQKNAPAQPPLCAEWASFMQGGWVVGAVSEPLRTEAVLAVKNRPPICLGFVCADEAGLEKTRFQGRELRSEAATKQKRRAEEVRESARSEGEAP